MYFAVITQKIGNFLCILSKFTRFFGVNFILQKFCSWKKITNIRYCSLWGNNLKKNRGSVVVKWKVCFKIVYLGVFTCIWRKWIRGNLLSWVILDETSATKLSWAAIERENGFCQAPLLSPFNYQQLMETSKTWGKIDDRAKREKEKKYSIQKQAKLRNWHFGRPLQCIDYCQRNKE